MENTNYIFKKIIIVTLFIFLGVSIFFGIVARNYRQSLIDNENKRRAAYEAKLAEYEEEMRMLEWLSCITYEDYINYQIKELERKVNKLERKVNKLEK